MLFSDVCSAVSSVLAVYAGPSVAAQYGGTTTCIYAYPDAAAYLVFHLRLVFESIERRLGIVQQTQLELRITRRFEKEVIFNFAFIAYTKEYDL